MPLDSINASENVILSPLAMLYHWEQKRGNETFLVQPHHGEYTSFTWCEVGQLARRVAKRLADMQLPKGSRIAIYSKNCAEWFIADLGIMMAGYVSVPIFATAGRDTVSYILQHADVKLVFLGKFDDPEKQMATVPEHYECVNFGYHPSLRGQLWSEFTQTDPIVTPHEPDMDEMMTIIYTSGSTGQPKGVVHTYNTICWAARRSLDYLSVNVNDRLISYLPLAHITERVLVELASYYAGTKVSFVESLDTFNRDVKASAPTLFISVPRLWTKFQMGILAKMPQKKLNRLLRIPIISGLVKKKIKQQLGFEHVRLWASGSAPLAPAVIEWFEKLGIHISEGWGMTENSAYGSASVPFRADKIGCIGKAYEGVDIRISDEGEIQVKAPCNMKEYYLEPEKTAEVFTPDRYLKTGDKGAMDAEGFIRITGRLKEIFKTAKGKYVAPAPIESKFMENPIIEQVCVSGNNLPQPIALVVLSQEARQQAKTDIETSLTETLAHVNASLESHQTVDRVVVMKDEWSIENDLLTPTLKVKRHVLESRFLSVIEGRYNQRIVWQEN